MVARGPALIAWEITPFNPACPLEKQIEHSATIFTFPWLAHDRKSAQFLCTLVLENDMTALNIVQFRVKPGHQEQFIAKHRGINPGLKGFRGGSLVRTGENTFCFIGEWTSFQKIADAQPLMIGMLDGFREWRSCRGKDLWRGRSSHADRRLCAWSASSGAGSARRHSIRLARHKQAGRFCP